MSTMCRGFLEMESSFRLREGYHLAGTGSIKSPCDKAAGAASLVASRSE